MSRLPFFDPEKVPEREAGPPARREKSRYGEFTADRPLTVTQLTELIKRVLADRTPSPVRVVGEVSNFSDRTHWYLSLKDADNVLNCVMWASASGKAGFVPQRGQQVVATGRLDYYGPQARLQMYIDRLEPVGAGALEIKFKQLCDELRAAGYFDDARKRPLPAFPRHIAVVTSAKGAAVQDVIRTALNRMPGVRITVVDVRVQGASAAPDVAAAIAMIDTRHTELGIDAIVLTRGGGSLEDLWAFNEKVVADAVFNRSLPIVAAIGHETDTTIAELVADLRCSTPTQAAERLIPDAEAERQRLDQLAARMTAAMRRQIVHARSRIDAMAGAALFRRPAAVVDLHRERITNMHRRLDAAIRRRASDARHALGALRHAMATIEPSARVALARRRIEDSRRRLGDALARCVRERRSRVDSLAALLEAISPKRILERGYTYTTDADGRAIRSAGEVAAGDSMHTHFHDGEVESTVGTCPAKRVIKPPRRKASEAGDGSGLFD